MSFKCAGNRIQKPDLGEEEDLVGSTELEIGAQHVQVGLLTCVSECAGNVPKVCYNVLKCV